MLWDMIRGGCALILAAVALALGGRVFRYGSMLAAQLGWWAGSMAGAATDPVIGIYTLAVIILVSTLRQFAVFAIFGGALVSVGISVMTYSFAQQVEPGIAFSAWALRSLVPRVMTIALISGVGVAIKMVIKKSKNRRSSN